MKNGAGISGFVMTTLLALKTKTNSIKTRLTIFSLLRNKKLLISSINHKLQALLALGNNNNNNNNNNATLHHHHDDGHIVLHHHHHHHQEYHKNNNNATTHEPVDLSQLETEGSVIDLVKKSRGGEFRLEDEIDQVADLFIKRFHRQILMQKQLSFNRNQDIILGHITPA